MASSENGPIGMYKLRSYYDSDQQITLPTCMYGVKGYHDSTHSIKEGTQPVGGSSSDSSPVSSKQNNASSSDMPVSPDVTALEKRQDAILEKLAKLKMEVDQMSVKAPKPPTVVVQPAPAVCPPRPAVCPPRPEEGLPRTVVCPPPQIRHIPAEGDVVSDVVINASAQSPPLSVFVLHNLLCQQFSVMTACHTHSSANGVPKHLKSVFGQNGVVSNRNNYQLAITMIWKQVPKGPTLMVSPNMQTTIIGESGIARYLARLLNPAYDSLDIAIATDIDSWVDMASQVISGSSKERAAIFRTMNAKLGKEMWLVGGNMSLADIALWSAIQQTKQAESVPANVKKWLQSCNSHAAFQTAVQLI